MEIVWFLSLPWRDESVKLLKVNDLWADGEVEWCAVSVKCCYNFFGLFTYFYLLLVGKYTNAGLYELWFSHQNGWDFIFLPLNYDFWTNLLYASMVEGLNCTIFCWTKDVTIRQTSRENTFQQYIQLIDSPPPETYFFKYFKALPPHIKHFHYNYVLSSPLLVDDEELGVGRADKLIFVE